MMRTNYQKALYTFLFLTIVHLSFAQIVTSEPTNFTLVPSVKFHPGTMNIDYVALVDFYKQSNPPKQSII